MVGEEDVTQMSEISKLQEGAGGSDALKPKENFERYPHLILLPDCARYLARMRSTSPPEKRGHIAVLEQQCREFPRDPAGMRKRMIDTIEAIETPRDGWRRE